MHDKAQEEAEEVMLFSEPKGVDRDHDDAKHTAEHSTKHCGDHPGICTGEAHMQSKENKANLEDWGNKLNEYGKPPRGTPPPAPSYHSR